MYLTSLTYKIRPHALAGHTVASEHSRKLLEDAQTQRQVLLCLGHLLSQLHLLQLLDVLVQLKVVQNHGHEQRHHNLMTSHINTQIQDGGQLVLLWMRRSQDRIKVRYIGNY